MYTSLGSLNRQAFHCWGAAVAQRYSGENEKINEMEMT
jgi:hypothetical protein